MLGEATEAAHAIGRVAEPGWPNPAPLVGRHPRTLASQRVASAEGILDGDLCEGFPE